MPDQVEDHKIISLIKDPETKETGFRILVSTYQKSIYWTIRRLALDHDDTNDLVQEVFVKIWLNLNKFKGNSKLYTWIYRIAINETLSFLQSKNKKHNVPFEDEYKVLSSQLQDDNYFSGDEVQIKFQAAIQQLPDKQKLVFTMKYYEDFTYESMSEILNTSIGALKASYHHAVKKIEKYITGH